MRDAALSQEPPHAENAEKAGAVAILGAILDRLAARAAHAGASDDGEPAAPDETEAGPTARLGDVIDELDERAFGLLLLLLALPCCLPFVYILPQIVALPMLALAGQLAVGRHHPWLPKKLHDRTFAIATFRGVLDRSAKYVGWVERFTRPRLLAVTGPIGARVVGVLLLAPVASILTPLPSTNTLPGIGVAIASVGLVERDGVMVIAGLIIGLGWVALLLFLGVEAAHFIKEWLTARF
ncbi:MAG: exopolysaccharide biosynthesis protein [Pseudomonadota bacterium]